MDSPVGFVAGPTIAATPAWLPRTVCSEASWARLLAMPGASTTITVGATAPGAKPRAAWP